MPKDDTLNVLIVDDERPARHRIVRLLHDKRGIVVAGEAKNGRQAIEAIAEAAPDLVFPGVQMPGMSGLDVVREVGPFRMPAVIFVTAYDQYAVDAFDVAALDYLLKPFEDERFDQALTRARETIATRAIDDVRRRLATLLGDADNVSYASSGKQGEPKYLERFGVEFRGYVRIVPVESIDFIAASGSYVELHVGDDVFVIREQMQVLEKRLDPRKFFRIHRSTIVPLDKIDSLTYSEGGDYAARLKDGTHLSVSRSRYEDLQQTLGLTSSGGS